MRETETTIAPAASADRHNVSDVAAGYKRTEVGVIPEGWEVRSILETCPLQRGFDLPRSRIRAGPYPVVYSNGILLRHQFAMAKGPGVVTGRSGTIGKVHFVEGDYWPHNTSLWVVSFRGNIPRFVYYLLTNIDFSRFHSGSGVPTLNRNDVHQHRIPVPPLPEQRAIAEALSDVDGLLKAQEALILKKRAIKQATMQQLLTGKTRLPGFSREWEVKRVGEVAKMASGGTPLTSVGAYYDGGIPWVSINDMTNSGGKIIMKTERSLSRMGLENSAARLFPAGTVLYAMYASIGECGIAGRDLCTSQAILGIQPGSCLHPVFLYYSLTWIKRMVTTLGQQGTQANLNKEIVQELSLPLPSVPEQIAIATVLSDMDTEIDALKQSSDKARALKQVMMQELLTGRVQLLKPDFGHTVR